MPGAGPLETVCQQPTQGAERRALMRRRCCRSPMAPVHRHHGPLSHPNQPSGATEIVRGWKPTPEWHRSEDGATISCHQDGPLSRTVLDPPAARGVATLCAGPTDAHELKFLVSQWSTVVGLTDAAEFDATNRRGGQSWGIEVLGPFFFSSPNAFKLSDQRAFDEHFHGHHGGCESKLGFHVECRINWPSRYGTSRALVDTPSLYPSTFPRSLTLNTPRPHLCCPVVPLLSSRTRHPHPTSSPHILTPHQGALLCAQRGAFSTGRQSCCHRT